MSAEPVQRRLAAILAADVAGYSRLMGEDAEGTLAALTGHLTELIEPCIAEHRGRVVKTAGDGLLAEFASVADAVRCAVAFQEGMVERNADTPEDLPLAHSPTRPSDAEARDQEGLEIARAQSAKTCELRAATCLARLWQSQSKTTEARDLLAPVYGWFTEGFDTADLKEAKALLDELT